MVYCSQHSNMGDHHYVHVDDLPYHPLERMFYSTNHSDMGAHHYMYAVMSFHVTLQHKCLFTKVAHHYASVDALPCLSFE
jgi:hypothetical protein